MKHYTLEILDTDNPTAKADVKATFDAPDNKAACTRVRSLISAMSDVGMSGSYKVVRHKRVRVNCKSCCEAYEQSE